MYQDFYNKKNEDYLNAFKQKVAEQKIATMEERKHELARSRNNFLGTLAGAVLAVVVGWFILMPQYKQASKDVPLIRRPQAAVKIKPENPGGMEIPNQDKDVYNLVEKKEIDNTVVENLLPAPEEPKLPDIVPETVNAEADNLDEIVEEVSEQTENTLPNKPEDLLADSAKENVEKVGSQVQNEAAEIKETAEQKVSTEVQNAETAAKTEVETATTNATSESVKENTANNDIAANKVAEDAASKANDAPAKTVADGKWQIQFVASKNKDAVEKTWINLTQKYSMLTAYSHEVQRADLGSLGVVYRLRAGNFASRDEASKVCAALKAKGMNDCIVKER